MPRPAPRRDSRPPAVNARPRDAAVEATAVCLHAGHQAPRRDPLPCGKAAQARLSPHTSVGLQAGRDAAARTNGRGRDLVLPREDLPAPQSGLKISAAGVAKLREQAQTLERLNLAGAGAWNAGRKHLLRNQC